MGKRYSGKSNDNCGEDKKVVKNRKEKESRDRNKELIETVYRLIPTEYQCASSSKNNKLEAVCTYLKENAKTEENSNRKYIYFISIF